MNLIIFLFTSIVSTATLQTSSNNTQLLDAMEQQQVSVRFTGATGSTHYLKPLTAYIQNLKNKEISIVVPAGYHFRSDDTAVQDIIITQEELIVLKPREELEINLSGMCIQHFNSSPGAEDGFKLVGFSKPELRKLAVYLDEKNIQNYEGQRAMWVVSDGEKLDNIIGISNSGHRELIDLTASITNQPTLTDQHFARVKQEVDSPVYKSELKGKFEFKFPKDVPIQIAIFDDNGIVLQEIYNQTAPSGRQEVTYTFDAMPYAGKTIHSKLIAFDKVLMDRKIVL